MTRQEAINHWAEDIILAVFKAGDKLREQLQQIIVDIAEEIVSRTTDEQLEQLEQADHIQNVEDEYHHKMTYPN